jgi:hypothetical protein
MLKYHSNLINWVRGCLLHFLKAWIVINITQFPYESDFLWIFVVLLQTRYLIFIKNCSPVSAKLFFTKIPDSNDHIRFIFDGFDTASTKKVVFLIVKNHLIIYFSVFFIRLVFLNVHFKGNFFSKNYLYSFFWLWVPCSVLGWVGLLVLGC